jgi:uracil-DNA glycosylase
LSDSALVHPVKEILALLDRVAPYPVGVIEVPHRIARTSFFPGGYGLWNTEADRALPPMPVGGIMVLGHDFHCEASYRRVLKTNGENLKDATWSNLLKLLAACGISTTKCFFTNFFMGLREGDKPMGTFPGLRDSGFVERCRKFFLHQLRLQRPRLVLTLGQHVPRLLAPLSPALKPWNSAQGFRSMDAAGAAVVPSAHFHCDEAMLHTTLVALVHPCMRNSNVHRRRYQDQRGDLAERRMIFDGLESAGITASDARVT